jgi:hypothetical protein
MAHWPWTAFSRLERTTTANAIKSQLILPSDKAGVLRPNNPACSDGGPVVNKLTKSRLLSTSLDSARRCSHVHKWLKRPPERFHWHLDSRPSLRQRALTSAAPYHDRLRLQVPIVPNLPITCLVSEHAPSANTSESAVKPQNDLSSSSPFSHILHFHPTHLHPPLSSRDDAE